MLFLPLLLALAAPSDLDLDLAASSDLDLDLAASSDLDLDLERATARTLELTRDLVALDTSNPPGNEMLVAERLAEAVESLEGFTWKIYECAPGRANFVARLHATNPTAKPVLMLGHMDVVGAKDASWSTPPFVATEKDGYLWGRGTMDDKGPLSAAVSALIELSSRRNEMKRDVIFLATAAEEGGPSVGIDWMVENERELLEEAEFALNEGGRVRMVNGNVKSVHIQTTEKIYYEVRVIAEGPGGHGSVPLPDNAIAALARAVNRVHEWRAPLSLNETTRLYFQRLAQMEEDPKRASAMEILGGGASDLESYAAANKLLSADPLLNAIMRSGASLTMFNGGFRANVIPSNASALFNLRTVPGDDPLAIVKLMQEVGGESAVTFELMSEPKGSPPPSPVDSDLYRALESAARTLAPEATILPFMSSGATDGAALRTIGVPTYGILPFPLEMEDELRMHGDDERVPMKSFAFGTELLYRTLAGVTVGAN